MWACNKVILTFNPKSICLQTKPQRKCFNREQSRKRLVAFYYCLMIVSRVNVYSLERSFWKCYSHTNKMFDFIDKSLKQIMKNETRSLSLSLKVATFQTQRQHLLYHHFQLRKKLIDWVEQVSLSGWILNAQINILQNISKILVLLRALNCQFSLPLLLFFPTSSWADWAAGKAAPPPGSHQQLENCHKTFTLSR